MIRSMTAFGSARAESDVGTVTVDLRSVNNRYLDLNFRLPEELRFTEAALREVLSEQVQRGKLELRLSFSKAHDQSSSSLNPELLQRIAQDLKHARQFIPDTPAPRLADLRLSDSQESLQQHAETWQQTAVSALKLALADLDAARSREGARLATAMLELSADIARITDEVAAHMPQILADQQQRITERLHERLSQVCPEGFANISGEELTARLASESTLFALRSDVAEELTRLRSHLSELDSILQGADAPSKNKNRRGSSGKRLDFLFQEMNREANTLGSKAAALSMTEAAIDLKLLIEQLREQAQNIE